MYVFNVEMLKKKFNVCVEKKLFPFFFFNKLNPTPKEKEIKEYELGLARAALGSLKRKGDDGGETSRSTRDANADASKFESLQWHDEMSILSKRRKIEKEREEEIIMKKKKALEEEINRNEVEEEEVEEEDHRGDPEIERLGQEVSARRVSDVQMPSNVLREVVGEFSLCIHFRIFAVGIFFRNLCNM